MTYYKCGSIYPTQNSNVVIDNASGAIANFQTPLAMPLKSLEIGVNAVQDLHGQSGPYPAGGGINKWDEQWELGIWNSSGQKNDSQNAIRCKNYIKINPSETYYVFANFTRYASGIILRLLDANKSFVRTVVVNSSSTKTFTADSNVEYVVWCSSSTDQITTYNNDVSINYPATDTSYHPYSNICPISGQDKINLTKCSKNLYVYDVNKVALGTTSTGTTRSYIDLGISGPCTLTFSASLKSGETPTTQYINIGKMSNGIITLIQALIQGGTLFDRTITFLEGEKVVIASASNQLYGITSTLTKYNIQVEIGDTVTEFNEYNGNTEVINLGGTYYGGHFTQDKDGKRELVVTKRITTLGALTSWRYAQGSGVWRFQAKMPNDYRPPKTISERLDFISSCFTPDLSPTTGGSVDNSIAGYTDDTKVYILCNSYTDLETFLTDLSNQTLVYTLAEPFTVALPDGEPIKSFAGVNNIYADTGDVDAEYYTISEGGND